MKSLKAKLNILYASSQALYWMAYCAIISTSSGYLAAYGYSSTDLGLMLAMSYAISAVLQQLLADIVDKNKKLSLAGLMIIILLVMGLGELYLFSCHNRSPLMTVVYIIMATWMMTLQPLINAYSFTLSKTAEVNFGIGRSMGSLFFSVMSLIVGNILEVGNSNFVALSAFIVVILMAASVCIAHCLAKGAASAEEKSEEVIESPSNLPRENILKKYNTFFILLVGTVFFSFGHSVINSFWHQITESVGGNDGDMGGLLAVQAVVELPAMIFFTRLKEKFGTKNLLIFAAIMYSVKAGATYIAWSIPMLYVAVIVQAFAFALFIPASVQLVNDELDEKDAVKGQALLTGAITISFLLSSVSGGILIDNLGVKISLLIGFIVSSVGSLISFIGLRKMKK